MGDIDFVSILAYTGIIFGIPLLMWGVLFKSIGKKHTAEIQDLAQSHGWKPVENDPSGYGWTNGIWKMTAHCHESEHRGWAAGLILEYKKPLPNFTIAPTAIAGILTTEKSAKPWPNIWDLLRVRMINKAWKMPGIAMSIPGTKWSALGNTTHAIAWLNANPLPSCVTQHPLRLTVHAKNGTVKIWWLSPEKELDTTVVKELTLWTKQCAMQA